MWFANKVAFFVPEADIAVTDVTLNKTELALKNDETATLTATVEPEGADDGITWTTSNNQVATVAPDGKVTAVASGTATITATSTADTTKKAECEVTVTNPATAIAIDETASILVGATKTLAVTTTPTGADELTYTWTSSATDVATVANGVVTGVAAGEAVITVKAGTLEATCTVTVTAETKPATKVTLNKTTLTLEEEETDTLTATITPADSTDSITWTSSDTAIATVDQTGKVTAVAEGTATITAKANDEAFADCAVTVTAKATPPADDTSDYALLYEGAFEVTTAYEGNQIEVANAVAGDKITVTYEINDAGAYHQLSFKHAGTGWPALTSPAYTNEWNCVDVSADGTFTFTLNAEDAANIVANKLVVSGYSVTITKVELNVEKKPAEDPTEPSSYETGNVETVTDYVPTTAGTKLVVMSITEAEAASTESYTITVTDNNGKTTSVTTNDCYKAFKYNTANGAKTETAANGFFIIVKVTGVPEGTTVSVTIEATE
ncbi:MAG: Ig-like domain-containing protein [Oscillospiraceae bacterium]|nr:Ig-like domain-containing protein [Oscillospiraceae bacterium]